MWMIPLDTVNVGLQSLLRILFSNIFLSMGI